jgi:hypothetical protein
MTIKKELLEISISSAIGLQKFVKIIFLFYPEMNLMILWELLVFKSHWILIDFDVFPRGDWSIIGVISEAGHQGEVGLIIGLLHFLEGRDLGEELRTLLFGVKED